MTIARSKLSTVAEKMLDNASHREPKGICEKITQQLAAEFKGGEINEPFKSLRQETTYIFDVILQCVFHATKIRVADDKTDLPETEWFSLLEYFANHDGDITFYDKKLKKYRVNLIFDLLPAEAEELNPREKGILEKYLNLFYKTKGLQLPQSSNAFAYLFQRYQDKKLTLSVLAYSIKLLVSNYNFSLGVIEGDIMDECIASSRDPASKAALTQFRDDMFTLVHAPSSTQQILRSMSIHSSPTPTVSAEAKVSTLLQSADIYSNDDHQSALAGFMQEADQAADQDTYDTLKKYCEHDQFDGFKDWADTDNPEEFWQETVEAVEAWDSCETKYNFYKFWIRLWREQTTTFPTKISTLLDNRSKSMGFKELPSADSRSVDKNFVIRKIFNLTDQSSNDEKVAVNPSYAQFDAMMTYTDYNDREKIFLAAKNLGNKYYDEIIVFLANYVIHRPHLALSDTLKNDVNKWKTKLEAKILQKCNSLKPDFNAIKELLKPLLPHTLLYFQICFQYKLREEKRPEFDKAITSLKDKLPDISAESLAKDARLADCVSSLNKIKNELESERASKRAMPP